MKRVVKSTTIPIPTLPKQQTTPQQPNQKNTHMKQQITQTGQSNIRYCGIKQKILYLKYISDDIGNC